MKKCSKCKIEKSEDGFYPHKTTAYGSSWCKECHKERANLWRTKNLERARTTDRVKSNKYAKINIEKGPGVSNKNCTRCKINRPSDMFYFVKHHKDGLSSVCKNCTVNNGRPTIAIKVCKFCGIEKIASDFHSNYTQKDNLSAYCKSCGNDVAGWYSAKRRDRKHNWVTCSLEEWIVFIKQPCSYCHYPAGGGDRIDNSFGHTIDNMNPSCGDCNLARNTRFTAQDMKDFLGPAIKMAKDRKRSCQNS